MMGALSKTVGRSSETIGVDDSATPEDALVLDSVDVSFTLPDGKVRRIFSDLNLTVKSGELVVIVGKSGGGKTTLLNTLVGVVTPDVGSVSVLGLQPKQARSKMGFMLARDALLPWRTAIKNVEYGLELRKFPRIDRRDVAMKYLSEMELSESASLWPWQLSQGMRQRVALARTWAMGAPVLLMDEPFAALDAQTRERVQHRFLNLWVREKRTVIFVTHDLEEAIQLGDRVVVLGDGGVIAERDINFERPRDPVDMVGTKEYRDLLGDLRELIL